MDTTPPQANARDTASEMAARLEQIAAVLQREVARLGGVRPGSEAETQLAQLQDELRSMGRLIAETRSEVAGLLPPGVGGSRLTSASGELDSVVGATERAAVEIMGAAERSQEAAQRLRGVAGLAPEAGRDLDVIEAAATDIFMACSFQDLTGQRIRKVVQALTYIEHRVNALGILWEAKVDMEGVTAPPSDHRNDAHLLNGSADNGLAQNDIDSLLGDAPPAPASQDDIDALFA
jgi:chemotaxis regulatin CheY-phosphate phosphatase CheZ